MKYDPASLFEIKIYKVNNESYIDVACSRKLLDEITKALNKAEMPEEEEELIKLAIAAIINFAYGRSRVN